MLRLTRDQVREIDRISMTRYHIPGIVLMENASRAVVDVVGAIALPQSSPILILCGAGNNGGDGLAVARHLHNRGRAVSILFALPPEKLKGDALTQWQIIEAMDLPSQVFSPDAPTADLAQIRDAAMIIDALLGTGLSAAPREPMSRLIDAVNGRPAGAGPVVAIDLPSGLDCDTGRPLDACIRATHTVTFVAEKLGFADPDALPWLGSVTVGDIGCPRELIQEIASGA